MLTPFPSVEAAKRQAKNLRAGLSEQGRTITHSESLELAPKTAGYKDWNTLHAAIGNHPRPPVALGQIVSGRYLKQPFVAEVQGVTELAFGRYEVVLHLAEAVDVVTFDSFSNFRSRIRKVIGSDGRSVEKTSDGIAHIELDL